MLHLKTNLTRSSSIIDSNQSQHKKITLQTQAVLGFKSLSLLSPFVIKDGYERQLENLENYHPTDVLINSFITNDPR